MKTPFCCYKTAIILTFFLSFTVASAVGVSILDVSVNGSSFLPGSSIEIDYVVHYNCISIRDRNFTLEAYASSDSTITDSDIYLGSESCKVDVGSGELSDTMTGYFPMDIPQGEYYIGIIHYTDSVYDPSPVTVEAAQYPDLELTSVGISGSYNIIPGETGTVDFTVQNIGSFESGAFYVYIYVSEDSTITDDDYEVAHSHPGSLAPGEDTDITKTFYLPDDIPPGDYYIGGIIDCSYDSNLGNNSCCGDSFTIVEPIDISVQDVSVNPKSSIPGGSINVTVTVENVEKMDSGGYTVDYYASTNQKATYFLGSLERDGLSSGETDTFNHLCQLPKDIPQGYYYIGAKITCYDDTDEDNNEGWSTLITVGPSADLEVVSVDVNDTVYVPGDQITIYSLVKNVGNADSEPYIVNYYTSADVTIDGQDDCLCSVNRNGLAAGAQYSFNTSFKLPVNFPEGNFYIGIIISCQDEYDQLNNVKCVNSMLEMVKPDGYVCGQIRYRCTRFNDEPVKYALVEIYDDQNTSSKLDDRMIGQTHTDHMGNYGVIVENNGQVSHKIYARVYTKGYSGAYPGTTSRICDVKDDVFGESYFSESPLYSHPGNSSVVIDKTVIGEVGAFFVYDSVVRGFHKAKTFFDVDLEQTAAYWPSSEDTTFYIPSVGIFVAEGDQEDRDVIMHEYGHYIANEFNFTQGDVGDDGRHYWDLDLRYQPVNRTSEQARNLAFREAWATLFSIATQFGDTGYSYSGDTKYQDYESEIDYTFEVELEEGTGDHDSPGQYYENMNTCALWDIFDDSFSEQDNWDTLSDISLSKIWSIMNQHKPDDIIDFWNSWFVLYDYEEGLRGIFLDHEMTFVEQP